MCATYLFSDEELLEIKEIIYEIERRSGEPVKRGDIYPNSKAPVISREGQELLLWGYPNFKGSGTIYNARSETVFEKKLFRSGIENGRCVIPAAAFYEWSRDKKRYRFSLPEKNALYLAGFYDVLEGLRRFVILTAPANRSVSPVHHRMPVILGKSEISAWTKDKSEALRILARRQPELLCAAE